AKFAVDLWGRLDRASEAARASLLGSRFASDVVTLSLGSLTAQTYFGLRSLDAQLAVLQETIRTRRDSVELARARLGAGLASELDLYQAQAALSDALVQRRDTERARALLEHQLGQLVGKLDLKLAAGAQTQARRRQALASYQRSIESGFREVSDALVNLEQTGTSEADLLERLQAARNALQLSSERYEAGYSPYLEVLDAQRTANEAELAFVRNRQARLAFSVDLMKALGGGWRAQ